MMYVKHALLVANSLTEKERSIDANLLHVQGVLLALKILI